MARPEELPPCRKPDPERARLEDRLSNRRSRVPLLDRVCQHRSSPPGAAQRRIYEIAQCVAHDVEGEKGCADRERRRDEEMRIRLDRLDTRGDHRAPTRGRGIDPDADEA